MQPANRGRLDAPPHRTIIASPQLISTQRVLKSARNGTGGGFPTEANGKLPGAAVVQRRIPKYRLHKPSGQAVVTLCGRDYYLGPHGSPASHAAYRARIAEWLAAGCTVPAATPLTVAAVCGAYLAHYATLPRSPGQRDRVNVTLRLLADLYGDQPAGDFGPLRLQAFRLHCADTRAWVRPSLNARMRSVVAAFRWAASRELIPASVAVALGTVRGVEPGELDVEEGRTVLPADEDAIAATVRHVPQPVADLINLQLLTASRPSELLTLRPEDLRRDGTVEIAPGLRMPLGPDVWTAQPQVHKTKCRGKSRILLFGPRAQEILARCPFVRPHSGTMYSARGYYQQIRRTQERHGIPLWFPYQLRHNAATRLVAQFGWDVARIVLGHTTLSTTARYALDDLAKAAEAIRNFDLPFRLD